MGGEGKGVGEEGRIEAPNCLKANTGPQGGIRRKSLKPNHVGKGYTCLRRICMPLLQPGILDVFVSLFYLPETKTF